MQCLLKVFLQIPGLDCLEVIMHLHLETEQVKTSVAPWKNFFNNRCIMKVFPECKFYEKQIIFVFFHEFVKNGINKEKWKRNKYLKWKKQMLKLGKKQVDK